MIYFSNNPLVLGENNRNLPILVQIISEALSYNVLEKDTEVKNRVLNLARAIVVNVSILYIHLYSMIIYHSLIMYFYFDLEAGLNYYFPCYTLGYTNF